MKLLINNINKSLNKSYLSQSLFMNEVDLFKTNFLNLLKLIQNNDSEETLKDYIHDFFKNTYYKGKFATKENFNLMDLVILNGKNSDDSVGIIIETKSIKNTSEMISVTDVNKKAFYEIVQYYLEERIIKQNIEIKHLIITNSVDWFIFDAQVFEKIFYQNKSFQKKYIDWYDGKLVSKNKDWFYNEIAKPFIQNENDNIECTYFQISKNAIDTEKDLIALYKIFSPEHLLKLSFQNDNNTLNSTFYNELLYIIGLQEVKINSVKRIERLPTKDRQEASLLENIINILQVDETLQQIENPEKFGENEEEQLFSLALELCITWLNRILFLKLLEGQLLKYNQFDNNYLFLNYQKVRDFEELRELFFEVLATRPAERKSNLQNKYQHVPYLNSSLFEQTTLEKQTVKINQLKNHIEINVYNGTILKNQNSKKVIGKKPILQYLFAFLDSYNFASNTEATIQEANKTIINTSVLGLIFEKINGYKDGSYFTPSFVTMYMCRETIRKAIVAKFKSHQKFKNVNNFIDVYNLIHTISLIEANQIFDSIKICDPAVGSGHFLVSALNELMAIKSDLGILIDKEGKLLRDVNIEVINDELFISVAGELFSYHFKNPQSQRIQETIFYEKQNLIENCLFGVDINPKSVNICRLRLWIELLKNAYYTHKSNFLELETLPNIDINIKCGNSLVSHFPLNNNDKGQSLQFFTQKYKQAVADYKNTNDRNAKRVLEGFIKEQKQNFARTILPNDEDLKNIKKIEHEMGSMPMFFSEKDKSNWKTRLELLEHERNILQSKYEEKLKTVYYEAFEWRFEFPEILDNNGLFIGFDVLIGNPPYGVLLTKSMTDYFIFHYQSSKTITKVQKGSTDTYVLFIERALSLLKKDGFTHFIVPISITCSDSMVSLHKILEQNCETIKISSYAVRPQPIFDNAVVDVSIVDLHKTNTPCKQLLSTKMYRKNKAIDGNKLMNNLAFVDVLHTKLKGRIPKISLEIEQRILNKLLQIEHKITDEIVEVNDKKIYYRAAGGRYFKVVTNYSTYSSAEKFLRLSLKNADIIGAILSSNLFFWYYQIFSDNRNLKLSEILLFPFPIKLFSASEIKQIKAIYAKYLIDIEKNALTRETKKYKNIDSFKEYKIKKSKHLIDKIDDIIANAYGLDAEELLFIKNCDIEFRIQEEENED